MDLEEMLKQSVVPETKEEVQQINTEVLQDGTVKEKIENETGEIYCIKYEVSPGVADKTVGLEAKFETTLVEDLKLLAEVQERVNRKKKEILQFLDKNALGSFKTDLLSVKYSSATTTTTIDTTRFKKEMPELAAKYSKVGSRSSSVSIELLDMPKLAKDMFQM